MDIFSNNEMIFAILNGKISAAINRKLYRSFRKNNIDITPEQWTVLRCLWSEDGVTQQTLCDATFKDKPSMTRLIDNMEKQKLVTRSSDPTDRRTNIIRLTEKGHTLEIQTAPIIADTIKKALQGLSKQDVKSVGVLLNHIFLNIIESMDD